MARCGKLDCRNEGAPGADAKRARCPARKNGEGQPLTKVNGIALAGRWYTWLVKQHEDDPGPKKRRRDLGEYLILGGALFPRARQLSSRPEG